MHDLVIRGGTVVDGTGAPPFQADVAIDTGVVTQVGPVHGRGREEIDAAGRLVTPGFVDIHTHYDAQAVWEQRFSPSSDHGVTTVVAGNCGVGVAPCGADKRELLISVAAGVEDIPENILRGAMPWGWETFPQYLDVLAGRSFDADLAVQIAHGPIRIHVMGQRGADREPANAQDLATMTAIVREALEAGAIGVSSSRMTFHRRLDGALAPCETASEEELLALARGVREAGRGVFEMISDFNDLPLGGTTDFDLLCRIARQGGCPLSVTLVQVPQHPEVWKTLLQLMEQANRDGVRIKGQVAPRANGMLFNLDFAYHPFCFHPSYQTIAALPLAQRIAELRKPELRARILAEQPDHPNPAMVMVVSWVERMFVLGDPPDYEPPPERSLGAIAQQRGASPWEVAYDLLTAGDGGTVLFLPASNYSHGTLDAVLEMLRSPYTVLGLGDGGAHYGFICDSSFPTFLLTHWVRDRSRGERVDLPWAVRTLTRDTAESVGLMDRGLLAPGYRGDANVIDFERLQLRAPRTVYDLPLGGRRLVQQAQGYAATIVGGAVTYRDGQATGALPGRLIRGQRAAPGRSA
ncbi:MAG: amidohydrolase family protein [Gammaproteobacteria bacterium]